MPCTVFDYSDLLELAKGVVHLVAAVPSPETQGEDEKGLKQDKLLIGLQQRQGIGGWYSRWLFAHNRQSIIHLIIPPPTPR